ncbi:MAG: GRP family sugar transporter [Candidatus Nanoarchaeia archaeon]|nr:GRP family sugar transporter [Candidatus Nanoarchaeia archaeon]
MWQIIVLIAAILFGVSKLLSRYISRKIDPIVYSFYYNLIFSLLFIFFLSSFSMPSKIEGWTIMALGSVFWSACMILIFFVYKHLDVSIIAPLENLTPLITLIAGLIFFNETMGLFNIIGAFLIFLGALLITWKTKNYIINKKGIILMLISVFFYSIAYRIDSLGVKYFNIYTYGFGVSFMPAILIGTYLFFNKKSFKIKKEILLKISISSILDFVGYLLILSAYTLTQVSNVAILRQLSIIIAVFGGFVFFKEKNILRKSIAALIIIIGAIFFSI